MLSARAPCATACVSSKRIVGYLSDSIDLLRSRSRRSLSVSRVLTGASTQPLISGSVAPPVISPVIVEVFPVKSPVEACPSKLSVPSRTVPGRSGSWEAAGVGVVSPRPARTIKAKRTIVSSRKSLLRGLGPRVEPVFPYLGEEGRAGDTQQVGGTSLVAASELEGLCDVLSFHGFQRLRFRRLLGSQRRPERPHGEVRNRQVNHQEI